MMLIAPLQTVSNCAFPFSQDAERKTSFSTPLPESKVCRRGVCRYWVSRRQKMFPLGQDMQLPSLTVKEQQMRCMRRYGESEEPLLSYPVIWRPWIPCHRETGCLEKFDQGNVSSRTRQMSKGAHGFQHPVRLLMPKSRTEEYLSHLGKKVLDGFPVQATLHFYNDDSSSEEVDDEELEVPSHSLDHRSHPLRENSER